MLADLKLAELNLVEANCSANSFRASDSCLMLDYMCTL